MHQRKSAWIVLFVTIFCSLGSGPATSADVLDFVVIQPGQPGAPQEAQPVMDALAAYIQKKMGLEGAVNGAYFWNSDIRIERETGLAREGRAGFVRNFALWSEPCISHRPVLG